MAVLDTDVAGQLYVGYNAARAAACLGYATREDVEENGPHRLPDDILWGRWGRR